MEVEARAKRTLHVGGLEDAVTEATLRAAFIPFGEVKDVNVPMNHATGKHRGFAFVEFEEEGDAREALDNMEGSELFGRTLHVKLARPQAGGGGKSKAVWSADEWYASLAAGAGGEDGGAAGAAAAGAGAGAGGEGGTS
jgi:peptidyl-prolyl isomerase E (cyclophilin E)